MNEFCLNLLNDLKLVIWGNEKFQESIKIEHIYSLAASLTFNNKNLAKVLSNLTKSAIKPSIKVLLYLIL